ncbi:MAG: MFS transporter [Proteobacteria bacterium]|nr:MFS transporter [Pseudomonadota bacterium]
MYEEDTKRMILVLGLMAFFCNGDNYAAAPLLVEIARDLKLDMSEAALSVTAYMLPFGLFTLLFGPVADRYGKAMVINIAAFGTALFSGLGALAYDLVSLSMIRAINGAFAAAILPVTISFVGDRLGRNPSAVQGAVGKIFGVMFLGGASATAIGGTLAYLGSWRLVYLVYGLVELLLAIIMLRVLKREPGTSAVFSLTAAYKQALSNSEMLKIVGIIFLMGTCVFGSFSYAGKFVESRTNFNILMIGLILTFFGVATVVGGKVVLRLRKIFGHRLFFLAGILAGVSWGLMGAWHSPILLSLSLVGFGFGFIMIQPTLVGTAQQFMPSRRGTAMSLASFAMFTGGGLGTALNGAALTYWGFEAIFAFAAILITIAGALTSILLHNARLG